MREVVKVARAINIIQPFLEDSKYVEYALGIHRAAKKYDIDPNVLIAITQQETNFRENLPEGKAGEIGICQIRKQWLKHPQFKVEFKKASIRDLRKPSKSFFFAAWILRDLKNSITSGTLPYWSFYNARKFENRLKYFMSVNKHIAVLKRHEPFFAERFAASEPPAVANKLKPVAYGLQANMVERKDTSKPKETTLYLQTKKKWVPDRVAQDLPNRPVKQAGWVIQPKVTRTPNSVQQSVSNALPPQYIRTAAELGVAEQWLVQ